MRPAAATRTCRSCRSFSRLLLNFTWWVNRKDPSGRNVFEGGFLGLDNIGVFDRSAALPTGGRLEQADGTAWMAMFSQNMLEMALDIAGARRGYESFVVEFVEHFFWIAAAMVPIGGSPDQMWDEEDGFFYDVLRLPDGSGTRIKVRSLVGLLPMCAATVVEPDVIERYPRIAERWPRSWTATGPAGQHRRSAAAGRARPAPAVPGQRGPAAPHAGADAGRGPSSSARTGSGRSPAGTWSIPTSSRSTGQSTGSSTSRRVDQRMFGGNSNWRGPVWFPVNLLLIKALLQHYRYYGDDLKVECPTGSGTMMTLFEVAQELSRRLVTTFLRGEDGRRPVYGEAALFQDDPHWRDHVLFYEYFHGDNGAGLGASHQTGWTGLVARLIQSMGQFDAATVLDADRWPLARPYRREG
jgi:hypothetical protein